MRRSRLKKAQVEELIANYAEAAAAHGKATEAGDYKTANKNADIVINIYSELRDRGPETQKKLLPLLEHPEPGVRSLASAHALEFAPEEGERVLVELARTKNSLVALSAQMALEQWHKGELRFP